MMNKRHRIFQLIRLAFILVASVMTLPDGISASPPTSNDAIQVKTAWSRDRARPGDAIALAIVLDIQKGFHINADARQIKPMADFKPFPTKVRVIEAHDGLTIEAPRYPEAHPIKVEYASNDLMSFEGKAIIILPIKVEDHFRTGQAKIKLIVEYQACAATYCLFPQKIPREASIAVVERSAHVSNINETIFADLGTDTSADVSQAVDFDLCESNAVCMDVCPEVFKVDDDDMLHILIEEPGQDLRGKVEEAVRLCPRQAITLE